MIKKQKLIALLALAATMTLGFLVGCDKCSGDGDDNTSKIDPSNQDEYTYEKRKPIQAEADEGFTIDGVLDEEAYNAKDRRWLRAVNKNGSDTTYINMTTVYGDKGIYIAMDVEETTRIYVNPDRSTTLNSCIELYLAESSEVNMKGSNIFEIDCLPNGDLSFKRADGSGGGWMNASAPNDIMAVLGSTTKGELNTDECYGYSMELYLPYEFLSYLKFPIENIKEKEILLNPAHITSYSYDGTDTGVDRWWYFLGEHQLDAGTWNNIQGWYHFDKNGLKSYDINIDTDGSSYGTVKEQHGYDFAVANNTVKLLIEEENNGQLASLKVNGVEMLDEVVYDDDGYAQYLQLGAAVSDIDIEARFVEFTSGNPVHAQTILTGYRLGEELPLAGTEVTVYNRNGSKNVTIGENGVLSLDADVGSYFIKADGFERLSCVIGADGFEEQEYSLQYSLLSVELGNANIKQMNDGKIVLTNGGRASLKFNDKFGDFIFSMIVKDHPEAGGEASRNQLEINFDNGKCVTFDVTTVNEGCAIQTMPVSGKGNIYGDGRWPLHGLLNEEESAQYCSEDGILFSVVRRQSTIELYIGSRLVTTMDYSAHGIADSPATLYISHWSDSGVVIEMPFTLSEELEGSVTVTGNAEHGSVSFDKTDYNLFDGAVISLTADEGYMISSLTVNGYDMLYALNDEGQLVCDKLLGDIDVRAIFTEKIEVNLSVEMSGYLKGEAVPLANTTVKLTNKYLRETIVLDADGTANITLPVGVYTLKADGYHTKTVEITEDMSNLSETLIYDMFYLHYDWNKDYTDLSAVNEAQATVTITQSGHDKALVVLTNASYDEFYITGTFSPANQTEDETRAQGVWVKFEDGKFMMLGIRTVRSNGTPVSASVSWETLSENWYAPTVLSKNALPAFDGQLDATLFAQYREGTLEITILRNANTLYAIVGGRLVSTVTLPEEYADMSAQIGLYSTSPETNATWGFDLGADTSDFYGEYTVTLNVGEHGSAEADEEVYAKYAPVTVNITPDEGYTVDKVMVNGADMYDSVIGNRLVIYGVTENLEVEIEFKLDTNRDVEITVYGNKRGETDVLAGVQVNISGERIDSYVTLDVEGKTVIKLPMGQYTVSAEAYKSATVTISEDDESATVTLVYDAFEIVGGWDEGKHDFTHSNDAKPTVSVTVPDKEINVISNEKFDDAYVTYTLRAAYSTDTKDGQGVWLEFENGKYMQLRIKQYTKEDETSALKIEWANNLWALYTVNSRAITLISELDQANTQEFEGENGLLLTVARKGCGLYAFIGDALIGEYLLPDEYADMYVRVGFYTDGAVAGIEIPFDFGADSASYISKITKTQTAITLSGTRLGQGVSLVGANVTLISGLESIEVTVDESGRILADLYRGITYRIVLDGYSSVDISGGYDGEVELAYQIFEASDDWDISTENDGTVTVHGKNEQVELTMNGTYTDFIFEVTAKQLQAIGSANTRTGIALTPVDGGNVFVTTILYEERSSGKDIHINNVGDSYFGWRDLGSVEYIDGLRARYYSNEGVSYKVVRQGAKIYLFVDNVLHYVYDMTGTALESGEVTVSLRHWGETGDKVIPFSFSDSATDIENALTCEITVADGLENGTLTLSSDISIGNVATLTVTPDSGYVMDKVMANGVDITSKIEAGQYTFMAYGVIEFTATFKQVPSYAVTITLNGDKRESEIVLSGLEITVKNSLITRTAVLDGNGSCTLSLPAGNYTVSVTAYNDAVITVAEEDNQSIAKTLTYNMFSHVIGWQASAHDLSDTNKINPTITVNAANATLDVITNESFDDVYASIVIKRVNSVHTNHVQGIWIRFDDEKFMTLRIWDNKLEWGNVGGWGLDMVIAGSQAIAGYSTIPASMIAKYDGAGLELTLARHENVLYAYADGQYVASITLPDDYATRKAQIGFYDYDSAEGASWSFDIGTNVTQYIVQEVEAQLSITLLSFGRQISLAGSTVTVGTTEVTLDAQSKATVTLKEGYYTVTVDGLTGGVIILRNSDSYDIALDATFNFVNNWNNAGTDLSGVNEAQPVISQTKSYYITILTNYGYDDAYASMVVKADNATENKKVTQGIWLRFADASGAFNMNNFMMLPVVYNNSVAGISWGNFDSWKVYTAIPSAQLKAIDSYATLPEGLMTKFTGDGLNITLARKGQVLYAFADGQIISIYLLPDEYANRKAQFGFYTENTEIGSSWNVDIGTDMTAIDAILHSNTITVAAESCTNGTLTLSPATINYGDLVTLTVVADEGYILSDVTVGGESVKSLLASDGTYKFIAESDAAVVASFAALATDIDVTLSVSGLKFGSAVSFEGLTVTLANEDYTRSAVIGSDGTATVAIPAGDYTVSVNSSVYGTASVTVSEENTSVTATLNYNVTMAVKSKWQGDLTDSSNGVISVTKSGDYLGVFTTQSYSNIYASMTIKGSVGFVQGIWIKNISDDHLNGIVVDSSNNIRWATAGELYGTRMFTEEPTLNLSGIDATTALASEDGLTIAIAVNNDTLYVIVEGQIVATYSGESIENSQFVIGYFSGSANGAKSWTYDIDIDYTKIVTVSTPEDEGE